MSNCNSLGDHVARHVGRSTKVALRNEEQDANLARLQGIKRALLQAKSVVLQELSSNVTASDVNLTEARADVLDLSASELERNMCLLLKERGRNKLRAIDDALERIEEGTFGICEDCGGGIPLGRLEVMPFAATCRDCKEKQERREKLFSTPTEHMFSYDPDDRGLEGRGRY